MARNRGKWSLLRHSFISYTMCNCIMSNIFMAPLFSCFSLSLSHTIYKTNDTYLRHIFITHCWTLGAHSDLATNRLLSLDNKLYFSVSWSGTEWKKCKEWCHIICFMWSDLSVISYCAAHVLVHILFLFFFKLILQQTPSSRVRYYFLAFLRLFLCIARISFEKS